MSIIFYLDRELKVFEQNVFVNEGEVELLAELKRLKDDHLNLFDRFEFLWVDLLERVGDEKFKKVFFFVAPEAGFTDTRVIYTWLKSWKMFGQGEVEYYIYKLEEGVGDKKDLVRLLPTARENGSDDLVYSREPRIGV